jgi:hypothetical protein
MTDISERADINPRRIAYFGEHRPASTLVEVSALVDPRVTVEIECQAVIPDEEEGGQRGPNEYLSRLPPVARVRSVFAARMVYESAAVEL